MIIKLNSYILKFEILILNKLRIIFTRYIFEGEINETTNDMWDVFVKFYGKRNEMIFLIFVKKIIRVFLEFWKFYKRWKKRVILIGNKSEEEKGVIRLFFIRDDVLEYM